MGAVTAALGTLAAIAAMGWILGRRGTLGPAAEAALARVVFTVAAPSLLMVTIAHADLHLLVSTVAVVTALSTGTVALTAVVVLRFVWRRRATDAMVGMLASSYLNAANLGIPVAVYLLGGAVAVVPTLLFQQLVLAPVAFLVLDASADTSMPLAARLREAALRPLRNPIIIGSLTGLSLAVLPWDLPEVVYEPFRLVGAAAAPLALITLGMSLAAPRPGTGRLWTRDLALVAVLRSVVHPALAAAIGLGLGLDRTALLTVVTMAALPTAQNVLVYALRYGKGIPVARDAGLVTTLLAVPVLVVVAALLG
ncbi:AEC family transporter [Actinotalea sp. BY-33]|uniref:AEC family transporter n=1 Tax=Actinotalea soli TaxID=2819234 RepID=A0A939RVL2_9CELL|nr:AEC family transporter [Actinotalea soli]MBO1752515.1 AEC family transporter [Actinotalea soli]